MIHYSSNTQYLNFIDQAIDTHALTYMNEMRDTWIPIREVTP